jgi:hypothetical protein
VIVRIGHRAAGLPPTAGAAEMSTGGVAVALLVVSALLWLALLPWVLGHWRRPTVGASFQVCVATEGLAVLAALVGSAAESRPVVLAGLAAFLLGLVLYGFVVVRFDWRQLAVGAGDHWVLAGALAISSLAAAELVPALARLGLLSPAARALRVLDLVLWGAAVLGYALLWRASCAGSARATTSAGGPPSSRWA